jgi:AcrR family transcriptional regulator
MWEATDVAAEEKKQTPRDRTAQQRARAADRRAGAAERRATQRERHSEMRAVRREQAAFQKAHRDAMADLRGRPTMPQPPIWARPTPVPRRRDRGLSRDRIVKTAIQLADAEGIDAVTMRAIAQKLRTGAMSLYWHVGSKDDLMDLMRDAVVGEFERIEHPSGDWRADLTALATDSRDAFLRHPWLTSVVGGRPTLGPNFLRHAELSLGVVSHLDADATTQLAIVFAVDDYVRGFVTRELEEIGGPQGGADDREWQESVAPYMREILESGDYPHLAAMIAGRGYEIDSDTRFSFGLQCLLDGIAARLPSAPA